MNSKIVSVDKAIAILNEGGVGILPTDTVYGLVARASDPQAIARLYELKHRERKPGTTIAASIEQLVELGVKKRYLSAIEQYWPNPLSVEMPLGNALFHIHQGIGHSAFRVVKDERVRLILEQTGPLTTSSANLPGEPHSTTVQQAIDYFGDKVDFYVDGGDIGDQPPSTVIRIVDDAIEVVRMGAVKINEYGEIETS
jgi:L-threonylcarbamoyladenylate synthase